VPTKAEGRPCHDVRIGSAPPLYPLTCKCTRHRIRVSRDDSQLNLHRPLGSVRTLFSIPDCPKRW
jgi:hypothetical protein